MGDAYSLDLDEGPLDCFHVRFAKVSGTKLQTPLIFVSRDLEMPGPLRSYGL
jgi:hypothetical protein